MSSRRSALVPISLMLIGVAMVATAIWWAWRGKPPLQINKPGPGTTSTVSAVLYRPADSDWWLVFGNEPTLARPVLANLAALDPTAPVLPSTLAATVPAPIAIAAAGPLRLWQFPAQTTLNIPASANSNAGRWHVETLADATLLFWLPGDLQTTAVDRVSLPAAGTGELHQRWLRQRLSWPDASCEALPALLNQLPALAQLSFREQANGIRWQLQWSTLPAALFANLQSAAAPQALADDRDRWFWREADLSALPRAAGCPALPGSGGFVARLWQEQEQLQAALARPGASTISGFPLPLPNGVKLKPVQMKTGNTSAAANSALAEQWVQQQTLLPEPGLLLAIQHRGADESSNSSELSNDGEFAGLDLRLRTEPPAALQLQWQWPLP